MTIDLVEHDGPEPAGTISVNHMNVALQLSALRSAVAELLGVNERTGVAELIEALKITRSPNDIREALEFRSVVVSMHGWCTDCSTSEALADVRTVHDYYVRSKQDIDDADSSDALLTDYENQIEVLRESLDNALHANFRMASVACAISGADMQAISRAAGRCGCSHDDESPAPDKTDRVYRRG